jgi:hypothetical protein
VPLIQAHITKVEQEIGSDWGRIETDHDTVKKLSTKKADLLREAAAHKQSGALVEIDYSEQVKRLDDGRTFRNYYYNGGGSLHENGAGTSTTAIPGIDMVQPQGREDPPSKKWSIALQGGGKLAVATLPLMPVDQRDFETQKKIALAWAMFFYFTPPPSGPGASVETTPASMHGAYSEPHYEQPPPLSDDDIPY